MPLQLQRVPENVVITTPLPASLHVTLRDKGFALLNYRYGKLRHLGIGFDGQNSTDGYVRLQKDELLKQLSHSLLSSTVIVGAKPDTLEYYYNHGASKRLPIALSGEFSTEPLHYITKAEVNHDSVTVFAPKSVLDTLSRAYLEPVHFVSLADTVVYEGKFPVQKGVKYEPSSVKVVVCVDRLVEKTVSVPVAGTKFPPGKVLRTFPSKVELTFQVGMAKYREVNEDDFVVAVDYETLMRENQSTCTPKLLHQPFDVNHVRMKPSSVEYVVEAAALTAEKKE